jgi:hypothetical protein
MKSERLYVRIDSDLKERLFAYCEKGRVNVSEFVCGMIDVTLNDNVDDTPPVTQVVQKKDKPPAKVSEPPKVVKRSSIWDTMDELRKS